METFSRKPIISKDGPDTNGVRAEVKVVTGVGFVHNIEKSGKGKSAKVIFRVENTKYLPAGWIPVDQEAFAIIEKAREDGEPIEFRIETHRKDNVDRSTPIADITVTAEIARDNVFKSLAAVKRIDDDSWSVSSMAKTNIAEDAMFGDGTGSVSANSFTIEQLREFEAKAAPVALSGGGATVDYGFEGSPLYVRREGGKINFGANGIGLLLEAYRRVQEHFEKINVPLSDGDKVAMTQTIIETAGAIQVAVYDGELSYPEMGVESFSTAVDLVFDAMNMFYPLPSDLKDQDEMGQWRQSVITKMSRMWKWAGKTALSISAPAAPSEDE